MSGVIIGVVLTLLYVKFGFTLPSWLQPAAKIKGFFITATASLFADKNDLKELQRQIAVEIKEDPEWYSKIDDSLGKFVTEEIVWRRKVKRTLKLLQDEVKKVDSIALSDKLSRQLREHLLAFPRLAVKEKEFAYKTACESINFVKSVTKIKVYPNNQFPTFFQRIGIPCHHFAPFWHSFLLTIQLLWCRFPIAVIS